MGLQYRRRVRTGRNSWLNLFATPRGGHVSESVRVGPATINSRGRVTVRTGIPGLFWRGKL